MRNHNLQLLELKKILNNVRPIKIIHNKRILLEQKSNLMNALSPDFWLKRGFTILKDKKGQSIQSIEEVDLGDVISIELFDGLINAIANDLQVKSTKK